MRAKKAEILGLLVVLAVLLVLPPPGLYADSPENDLEFAKALVRRARSNNNTDYLRFAEEVSWKLERSGAPQPVRERNALNLREIYKAWFALTNDSVYERKMEEVDSLIRRKYPKIKSITEFDKHFKKMMDANQKVADAKDLEAAGGEKGKAEAKKLRDEAKKMLKEVQAEFERMVKSLRARADALAPPEKLNDPAYEPSKEAINAMFKRNFAEVLYAQSFLIYARAATGKEEKRKALEKAEGLFKLYIEGEEEEDRFGEIKDGKISGMGQKGSRDGQFPVLDGTVKVYLGEVYLELYMIAKDKEEEEKEKKDDLFSEATAYFDEAAYFSTNEPMNPEVEKKILDINMQGYFRMARAYNTRAHNSKDEDKKTDDYETAIITIKGMLDREHKVCPNTKCGLWSGTSLDECGGWWIDRRGNQVNCHTDLMNVKPVKTFPTRVVGENIHGKQAMFELAEAYTATGKYMEGVMIAHDLYDAERRKRTQLDDPTPVEVESAKRMANISLKTKAVFPARVSFGIAKGFFYLRNERRAAMAFKDVVSAAASPDEKADYAAPALLELGKLYYHRELWLMAYTAFITLAREHQKDGNAADAAQFAGMCLKKLEEGYTDDKRNRKPEKLNTGYMKDLKKEADDLFTKLGQGLAAQRKLLSESMTLQNEGYNLLLRAQKEENAARKLKGDAKTQADKKAAGLFKAAREKYLAAAESFQQVVEVAREKSGKGEKETPVPFYPVARQWCGYCYMQAAQTHNEGTEAVQRVGLLAKAVPLLGEAIAKANAQGKLADRKNEERRLLAIVRAHLYLGQTHLDGAWPVKDRETHRKAAVKALEYFDGKLPNLVKVDDYAGQARLQQIFANFPLENFDAAEAAFEKLKDGMRRNPRRYDNYTRFAAWWLGDRYKLLGEDLAATGDDKKARPFFVKAAKFLDQWIRISGSDVTDGQKLWVAGVQVRAGRFKEAISTYESFFSGKKLPDLKGQVKTNFLAAKLGYANCLVDLKKHREAAAAFDFFKETDWKDKLPVVEGRGDAYFQWYLETRKKGDPDPVALKQALMAYSDLYRRTPETPFGDDGKRDENKLMMAKKHWQFTYRLLWCYYYQQRYIAIRNFLKDFVDDDGFDSEELKDVISKRLKEKLMDLYKLANKKAPKKK